MTGVRECRHVVVRGKVQGVAFRWSTREQARARALTGWVRNVAADASVEVLVQGEPAPLAELLAWLHGGPPGARVDAVSIAAGSFDESLADFEIRPTLRP